MNSKFETERVTKSLGASIAGDLSRCLNQDRPGWAVHSIITEPDGGLIVVWQSTNTEREST